MSSFVKSAPLLLAHLRQKQDLKKIVRRQFGEILINGNISRNITGLKDPEIISRLIKELRTQELEVKTAS